MADPSPARLIGAIVIGVWLAATVVVLLGGWRRMTGAMPEPVPEPAPAPPPAPGELPRSALSPDVFNLSSLPIWWLDRNLRLAGANDAYARVVGHPTPASAVRANAALAPGVRGLAAEARATDRAVVGEERVSIDGERRLLEILAVPLRGGEVAHLALDETRRHAAHTAAAARARALADTLDELTTAIALFDADRALVHANAPFAAMFGLDPAWLDTRPDFDRLLDAMRAAHVLPQTADYAAWSAQRAAWFAAAPGTVIEQEWTLPGGTMLRVTARPRDGGLLLVFDDETESALLSAGRDALLATHRATLEHLREGVAVFGPDGRLKLFNRRFAEIVVAAPGTLAPDLSAERLMDHIAGLLNDPGQARDLRELIVRATAGRASHEGRTTSTLGYTVEYSAVPLPDGNALITFSAVERADRAAVG